MLVNVKDIQDDLYNDEEYEVFDEELQEWVNPSESCYHQFHQGFPVASKANAPITMIQIYDNFAKRYIVLGRKEFTGKFEDQQNTTFINIPSEKKLLESFLKLLEKMRPSIISGWNSMLFDIPYITNRVARVLDGWKGDTDYLNKSKSYIGLKNVARLSPVGRVYGKKAKTQDAMEGVTSFWMGISLVDYRELTIKYGYLGLPSYSLSAVATHFKLSQKLDHSTYAAFDSFYTGENYIFPEEAPEDDEVYNFQVMYRDGKCSKKELQQVVYNRFVDYSLRDVEILVQMDAMTKYLASQQGIAYTCSVSFDDAWGTARHWSSYMFTEALQKNEILPLTQRFADKDVVFLAGWVRNVPGKYQYISSFDFTSLYPSLIMAFNIGADVFINEIDLPEELRDLRKKFFTYHTMENVNRALILHDGETKAELGEMVRKHKGEISDLEEETIFYKSLIDNKDEISAVLRKYDVCATPNGFFYKRATESQSSVLMRRNFQERVKAKRGGQADGAEIEKLKLQEMTKDIEMKIEDLRISKELNENISQVLKILLNSYYGSLSMGHITYSNGNITASSITTAGRMANKIASMYASNEVGSLLGDEPGTALKYVPQVDTDSYYLNLGDVIENKMPNATNEDKIKESLELSNTLIDKSNTQAMKDIAETLNLRDTIALNLENEIIADGFVSLGAKRYFGRKVVEDGTILGTPKMKSTGISLVSKSTPKFLREKLGDILEVILDGTNSELNSYIKGVRSEFGELNPLEFCRKSKVNNLDYDPAGVKYKKKKITLDKDGNKVLKYLTAPIGSHSSLEYNKLVKAKNLIGKYAEIEKGESIQYVYIQEPNELHIYGTVGWTDPKFIKEVGIDKIVDRDIHFEKDFLKKVDIVIKPIGWDIRSKIEEVDVW